MNDRVDHIAGQTWHGRKGAISNAFRYSIDYVLMDAEQIARGPSLFRRNGGGICALNDADHGGAPGQGRGAAWVRDVLRDHQIPQPARIEILAQPRFWGHVFNPVSFWLCRDGQDDLTCVIAEVTNTYGDRHSYLCHHADHRPIRPTDRLTATKILHVSPFQPVEGGYEFRFDVTGDRVGIWIDYSRGKGGLIATLTGHRAAMTNRSILRAALRRPLGSRRVQALIHWQALKLWLKKARFRSRPTPPAREVSR
jgi:DUF1365 family protein